MIEHIVVFNDEADLWATCEQLVQEQVAWVTGAGRRAGIFVAGGGTYIPLYGRMGDMAADVFPTDERMVPSGSSHDTGAMLQREWLGRLINPAAKLFSVPRQEDAPNTALLYEQHLHEWEAHGGVWATALMGVGFDGHTASLFPGQRTTWEGSQSWVVPAEAEQEPFVSRITVTPALLSKVARHVYVLTGSEKTDIARRWLRERESLPVEYVQPMDERYVLLDRIAARDLEPQQYDQR